MPDINGFQLAKKIYSMYPFATIVFCSNHDDLVFDAFKLDTFYFVRKSFLEEDLSYAFQKFIAHYVSRHTYFPFHQNGEIRKIEYTDIVYFEVSGNDLFIHCVNECRLRTRKTMSALINEIKPGLFVRISQSYLVNLQYIESVKDHEVTLLCGKVLTIPKMRIKQVKEAYIRYLMG